MERYTSYVEQWKGRGTEVGQHLLKGAYALIDVLIILGYIAYHLGKDLAVWVEEQRTVDINDLDIIMDEVDNELGLQDYDTGWAYSEELPQAGTEKPTLPRTSVMSAYYGGQFNYGGDVFDEVAYEVVNGGQAFKLLLSMLCGAVGSLTGRFINHVEPAPTTDTEEEVLEPTLPVRP